MKSTLKQLVLKPQDFLVALKSAVNNDRTFLLAILADELCMAVSAVHGCVVRCEQARLISRASGEIRPINTSISEFALHGVRYAFPPVQGPLTRGVATTTAGPSLVEYFDQAKAMPHVWPDALGTAYGPALLPLHTSVPEASRLDQKLFDALTLIDAVRAGAARERELAIPLFRERLA